jgi:hypothetical protein
MRSKEERSAYMREWRKRGGITSQVARNDAERLAARWVRERHPRVWASILRECKEERGLDPEVPAHRPRRS